VIRRLEEILEESSGDGSSRGTEEEMDMDLGEEDLDGKARMREVRTSFPIAFFRSTRLLIFLLLSFFLASSRVLSSSSQL